MWNGKSKSRSLHSNRGVYVYPCAVSRHALRSAYLRYLFVYVGLLSLPPLSVFPRLGVEETPRHCSGEGSTTIPTLFRLSLTRRTTPTPVPSFPTSSYPPFSLFFFLPAPMLCPRSLSLFPSSLHSLPTPTPATPFHDREGGKEGGRIDSGGKIRKGQTEVDRIEEEGKMERGTVGARVFLSLRPFLAAAFYCFPARAFLMRSLFFLFSRPLFPPAANFPLGKKRKNSTCFIALVAQAGRTSPHAIEWATSVLALAYRGYAFSSLPSLVSLRVSHGDAAGKAK